MSTKIEWTEETWNPIPSYPEYLISKDGQIFSTKTNKLIKLRSHENLGHQYFTPERGKKCYVHRAVLEAYEEPCPSGMECRHLDGNPKNNKLSNLKWGTRYENAQDTKKHGKKPKGEKAPFSTMSNQDAIRVRELHQLGYSSRTIGKMMNVSHTTIQKIIRRERYVN